MGIQSEHVCHFCRQHGSKRARVAKAERKRLEQVAFQKNKKKNKKKGQEKKDKKDKKDKKEKRDGKQTEAGAAKVVEKKEEKLFRAPHLQCSSCSACWISEDATLSTRQREDWVCPLCSEELSSSLSSSSSSSSSTSSSSSRKIISTTFGELLSTNPMLIVGLGLRKSMAGLILRSGKFSMVSMCTTHRERTFGATRDGAFESFLQQSPSSASSILMLRGKPVLDEIVLMVASIQNAILQSDFEECCSLCYGDFAVEKLRSPCGRECEVVCCVGCLQHWYGENRPGGLYLESHSVCPFCRSPPTFTTLRQFNPRLSGIEGRCKSTELDRHFYHAWCLGCGKVAEALPRECAGGEIPVIGNFTCGACRQKQRERLEKALLEVIGREEDEEWRGMFERMERVVELNGLDKTKNPQEFYNEVFQKMEMMLKSETDSSAYLCRLLSQTAGGKLCPKCGVVIEKDGGCNHMECAACNTHFCWLCLEESATSTGVYTHLHSADNDCMLYSQDE